MKKLEDVLKEYGDITMEFQHYYKYEFVFHGENDKIQATGTMGGDSDSIYKLEVGHGEEVKLSETEDKLMTCNVVDRASGENIYSYSDW